jgi:hypothetical protein
MSTLNEIVTPLLIKARRDIGEYYESSLGIKMLTRGDGVRYKDPNLITFHPNGDRDPSPNEEAAGIHILMCWLYDHPRSKVLGEVRDEFGSSPYGLAISIDGVIFIDRKTSIQYGTKSILRNTAVWNLR